VFDVGRELADQYNLAMNNKNMPKLVILDGANGETFTKYGREIISEENYIESFPWKPVPMSINQFPAELLKNSAGDKISTAVALKGIDALGIFFGKNSEQLSKHIVTE